MHKIFWEDFSANAIVHKIRLDELAKIDYYYYLEVQKLKEECIINFRKIIILLLMIISITSITYITSVAYEETLVSTPAEAAAALTPEEYLHLCTLETALRTAAVAEVEIDIDPYVSENELQMIAQTVYGEGRGSETHEQAAIIWCILNRVDTFGGTVTDIITAPNQFLGYRTTNPVLPELYDLAVDVVTRYVCEKNGSVEVGRVLPSEYLWFSGDMKHNYFRNAYSGGDRWDFSYENPYITE